MVEVFAITLLPQEEFLKLKDTLLEKLPLSSREKVLHYIRPEDIQRSLLGELMIRAIINQKENTPSHYLIIEYTEKGKPFFRDHQDIHFNISHSGQWVVCAVSSAPVGIDVEEIRPYKLKIAERFFTKEEFSDLMKKNEDDRVHYFFELWTLKESYLKALGKGLTKTLNSFTIQKVGDEFRIIPDDTLNKIHLKIYDLDQKYKMAVCAFEEEMTKHVSFLNIKDLMTMINDQ
ncbi:MAG: 4'-phosphopantetheinyl transferase superfamily protein [Bacteroidetes bacterium]|nr:4'-phosphopantetheinyl transferase superfamily protein [Bacteroidota bacterium]